MVAAGDNILNYGQDSKGGVYAVGYGGNTISPAKADEIGLTIKSKNPFDMSFGDHMSQIGSDVGTMASKVANDIKKTSLIGQIFGGG